MTDKPENPQTYLRHEGVEKAGGFAYPQFPDRRFHVEGCSMTLRDYFAGQVDVSVYEPKASFERANGRSATIDELASYIAEIRMIEADAMLKEREK